jgi:hypothetical protein
MLVVEAKRITGRTNVVTEEMTRMMVIDLEIAAEVAATKTIIIITNKAKAETTIVVISNLEAGISRKAVVVEVEVVEVAEEETVVEVEVVVVEVEEEEAAALVASKEAERDIRSIMNIKKID